MLRAPVTGNSRRDDGSGGPGLRAPGHRPREAPGRPGDPCGSRSGEGEREHVSRVQAREVDEDRGREAGAARASLGIRQRRGRRPNHRHRRGRGVAGPGRLDLRSSRISRPSGGVERVARAGPLRSQRQDARRVEGCARQRQRRAHRGGESSRAADPGLRGTQRGLSPPSRAADRPDPRSPRPSSPIWRSGGARSPTWRSSS